MIPSYSAELNLLAPKTGLNGKPFPRIFVIVVFFDFEIPAQMIGKIPAVKNTKMKLHPYLTFLLSSLKACAIVPRSVYSSSAPYGTPRAKRASFFPLSLNVV